MGAMLFAAVGHNGLRITAPDGRSWGALATRDGQVLRGVAIGNKKIVTVGTYGGDQVIYVSADGKSWKDIKLPGGGYSNWLRSLAFLDGKFVALGGDPVTVGAAQPFLRASADGETWSLVNLPGKHMVRRVAFGNGVFVGVGDRGVRMSSRDGLAWKEVPDVKPIETLIDIAFGAGVFVGVGLHGLRMLTADGVKWEPPLRGEEGEHLNSIVWAGDRFVSVGVSVTYTSRDGRAWQRSPNQNPPITVAFGRGIFLGPRWRGRLMYSTDAVGWEEVHRCDHPVEAVAAGEVG